MHPDDQHLLVIGSVEDPDPPALREISGRAPKKVVLQFRRARMLETEYLAALRIDAGHYMLNSAVLASRVHGLKNQQDGMMVGCVEKLLLCAQACDMVRQQFLVLFFGFVHGIDQRRPLSEVDLIALPNTKVL
jgi:hypothetical protein